MRTFLVLLGAAHVAGDTTCNTIKSMYQDATQFINTTVVDTGDSCCASHSISQGSFVLGLQKLLDMAPNMIYTSSADDETMAACSTVENTAETFLSINSHVYDLQFLGGLQVAPAFLESFKAFFDNPQLNPTNLPMPSVCTLLGFPELTDLKLCYKLATNEHMLTCTADPKQHRGKTLKSVLRMLPVLSQLADSLTPEACAATTDPTTATICLMKMVENENKMWTVPCVVWLNQPLPPGAPDTFRNLYPVSYEQSPCWASTFDLLARSRCNCVPAADQCDDAICDPYSQCEFIRVHQNPGPFPDTTICSA